MRNSYGRGYKVSELSQPGMIEKKFGAERIKLWIEDFLDAGEINLAVFCSWMVAVDHQAANGQDRKEYIFF